MRAYWTVIVLASVCAAGCGKDSNAGSVDAALDSGEDSSVADAAVDGAADSGRVGELDQAVNTDSGSGFELKSDPILAQTFTVGISGTLVSIELVDINAKMGATPCSVGQPLVIEIRPTDTAGYPDKSSVLASATIPEADVMKQQGFGDRSGAAPALVADLASANVQITSGQVLAIVARIPAASATCSYRWWGDGGASSDVYAGGSVFTQTGSANAFGNLPAYDMTFRTFVQR